MLHVYRHQYTKASYALKPSLRSPTIALITGQNYDPFTYLMLHAIHTVVIKFLTLISLYSLLVSASDGHIYVFDVLTMAVKRVFREHSKGRNT